MAERQFGPYRLVRQIAVGGMAEIHLAKTKGIAGFEKYVALKMIHPNFAEDEQFIQMLVDEAKIAVQLNHGNIAQTFDLGRVGDTYYITMEYIDGADLYKLLRRGSEVELEMPLDVCAFVGKEVASALDHAHRKKDHAGKSLGIVHRDVSPQNVLISYSGEVKLVDFGIAKATMKARQTAAGVIKGKYYYMSPEQAWGDPIDFRSDIFSAGIVLYEMLTGQMLYLEEDLHKLLDMARRAEIAPPSTLRRGIPPQLERIVMHALTKEPGERYQSAGDFATDLERFLHSNSPVFTAAKLSTLIKQIVGDPTEVPYANLEVRDGPISTHTLNVTDIIHSSDELRDENSVIFRLGDLEQPKAPPPAGPRVTRQAELPPRGKIPSVAPPIPKAASPRAPTPQPRAQTKQRMPNEETREVDAPPSTHDEEMPGIDDDLENIGERTMITGAPKSIGGGFMMDVATEDGVDATMVPGAPPTRPDDLDGNDDDDSETMAGQQQRRVLRRRRQPDRAARLSRRATASHQARRVGVARDGREDPRARRQRAAQATRVAQDARCRRSASERLAGDRQLAGERADAGAAPDGTTTAAVATAAASATAAAAARAVCKSVRKSVRRRRVGHAARRRDTAAGNAGADGAERAAASPTVCDAARLSAAVSATAAGLRVPAAIPVSVSADAARGVTGRAVSAPTVWCAAAEADDAHRPDPVVRSGRDAGAVPRLGWPQVAQAGARGDDRDLRHGRRDVLHHPIEP